MSDTVENTDTPPTVEALAEPSAEAWQTLTDATAAAIKADEHQAGGAEAEESPEADDADEGNPSKREARYRVQLRQAEAERDQLRGTVEAMQRAEVERIAGASIQKPSALWSSDVEMSSLLDDAGRVDPKKVDAAVKQATDTLGLAAKRPGGYVAREGTSMHQPSGGANTWEEAFKV